MGILTRFRSDERLQADALDILSELIKRDLLRIDVRLSDPPAILGCRPADVYVTGERSATSEDILRWHATGKRPNRLRGPGIRISLADELRPTPDQEAKIRGSLGNA